MLAEKLGLKSSSGLAMIHSPRDDRLLRRDVISLLTFFCAGLTVLYCAVSALPPMDASDRTHLHRPRDIEEFHAIQARASARRPPRARLHHLSPCSARARAPRPHCVRACTCAQTVLLKYRELNSGAVLAVFMCAYIFMQAFAIPGSVIFSLLSGPLFGPLSGYVLVCISTTVGAIACYCVSNCFMRRLLAARFPARVAFLEQKVKENADNVFYFMLSLRMSPLLPNWFVNAASPVAGVSLREFSLATLVGLMPINFLHVQAGARAAAHARRRPSARRACAHAAPPAARRACARAGLTIGYAHSLSSALQNYRRVLLLLSLSLLALVPVYIKARRRRKGSGAGLLGGHHYHKAKTDEDELEGNHPA